jgi:hypothetical protein
VDALCRGGKPQRGRRVVLKIDHILIIYAAAAGFQVLGGAIGRRLVQLRGWSGSWGAPAAGWHWRGRADLKWPGPDAPPRKFRVAICPSSRIYHSPPQAKSPKTWSVGNARPPRRHRAAQRGGHRRITARHSLKPHYQAPQRH